MVILICLVAFPLWFICHDWIKLSDLTSVSIIVSVLLLIMVMFDISNVKTARKKLKENKKCNAKLIDMKEIKGYGAKKIYTFELDVSGNKYIVVKENVYKKIGINEVMDVYPIYDNSGKVTDFDYGLEVQSKYSIWLIVGAVVSVIISVFLILNDGLDLLDIIGDYIFGILMGIFFLIVGIHSLKRYLTAKYFVLIPVNGKIVGFHGHHSVDNGIYIEHDPKPIYEVIVNGETHKFIGDKSIKRQDRNKYINTVHQVYYDKESMEFFDNKKSKADLFLAIMMFSFVAMLLVAMFK